MKALYQNLQELGEAIEKIVAINRPIRCYVERNGSEPYSLDMLPIREGEGIEGILLHDGPFDMKQGVFVGIDDLDCQFMTWEEIEVTDFDWEKYLPLKNA